MATTEGAWKGEFAEAFASRMRGGGYADEASLQGMARKYADDAWLERDEDSRPEVEARSLYEALGEMAD